jgi:hypothetical protein
MGADQETENLNTDGKTLRARQSLRRVRGLFPPWLSVAKIEPLWDYKHNLRADFIDSLPGTDLPSGLSQKKEVVTEREILYVSL